MVFLGQFDLAEVALSGASAPLASAGLLLLFFDLAGVLTGPPAGHACIVPADNLSTIHPPSGAVEVLRPRPVVLHPALSLPDADPESPFLATLELTPDEKGAYADMISLEEEIWGLRGSHQLFGFPRGQANDVHLACVYDTEEHPPWFEIRYQRPDASSVQRVNAAARTWRLLAQFGEDERVGMRWLDDQPLAFMLPEARLARGDLDATLVSVG
jgi:hypothetical protein